MPHPAKYPVGIQDFAKIRKEGYVYVDKTALMWRLIDTGCYYFNFSTKTKQIDVWRVVEA